MIRELYLFIPFRKTGGFSGFLPGRAVRAVTGTGCRPGIARPVTTEVSPAGKRRKIPLHNGPATPQGEIKKKRYFYRTLRQYLVEIRRPPFLFHRNFRGMYPRPE